MTATQTPLRREPCSTHRRRISIGDARSWRGINDGSFLPQAVVKQEAPPPEEPAERRDLLTKGLTEFREERIDLPKAKEK